MEIALSQQNDPTLAETLSRIKDALRRRWKIMALVSAAVFVLGTVAAFMMTPQYSATARLRIDPSRDPMANQQNPNQTLSDEAIDTEVSAFYSLDVATAVVRKLKLANDPEFRSASAEGLTTTAGREAAVAAALLTRLSVEREGQTYVLRISFQSPDPVKASEIATAFAEAHIEGLVNTRTNVASGQADWYQQQLTELNSQVLAAEAQAAKYRAENGLALGGSDDGYGAGTIADQQVPALTSSLAEAESAAAAARANYGAALSQARQRGAGSVVEVIRSPVISDLRAKRTEILTAKADLESRYGARHPNTQKLATQIDNIDQQLQAESQRIISSLGSVSAAADARAASIRSSLGKMERSRADQAQAKVIADSLSREAEAKRDLYKQMSEESLQARQGSQNSMTSATVLDRATPPKNPSSPNIPLYMSLSLMLGLLAGAGTIAVQEMMAGTVLKSSDVEEKLGLPLLAVVPQVGDVHPAKLLVDRPTSFFAEAFRIARGTILGSGSTSANAQVLAFTSAVPGEGKTTTSISFARTLAMAGLRTLVVDCDLRRAALQGAADLSTPSAGLVEYLSGTASLSEIISSPDVDNLDIILVREPYFASTNLFESGQMHAFLETVRKDYDHIVLDLPPVMGLADGRMLANHADTLIFVVKWNSTPLSVVQNAIEALRKSAREPRGVIVNAVQEDGEPLGGGYYQNHYSYYYRPSNA